MKYLAYTDGACATHTTKCGGAAVVLIDGDDKEERSSFHVCETTSQRMELEAIIEALDMVPPLTDIFIKTDSMYVAGGYTGSWNLKHNLDLWARLRGLAMNRMVILAYIPRNSEPGHAEADGLASQASKDPHHGG